MLQTLQKQPADKLDYDVDYGSFLPDGDEITTVTAVVEEIDPLTDLVVDSVQVESPVVKVWLSGGLSGSTYKVTVTAATSGGRIKEQDFKIRVRDY